MSHRLMLELIGKTGPSEHEGLIGTLKGSSGPAMCRVLGSNMDEAVYTLIPFLR